MILSDSFLGIGVSVIPDVSIGEGTIVAAGACVTKSLPDHVMAAGVPVRVKKTNVCCIQKIPVIG